MKVDLQVRMELDGIRAVLFDRRAGWAFTARCANCGEAFPQNIHLDPSVSPSLSAVCRHAGAPDVLLS